MESVSKEERRKALSRRRFFGSVAGGATEAALIGAAVTAEAHAGKPASAGRRGTSASL